MQQSLYKGFFFFNYQVCFYIYDLFTGLPLTPTDTLMQRIRDKLHRNVDKITRTGPSVDSVVRSMGHGLYENSVDRLHI